MSNLLTRRLIARGMVFKLRNSPLNSLIGVRNDTDFCADKYGNREIVGYGWNGCPSYYDRPDFPFPSIRFREPTAEICALREKEKSDWKKLTIEEKKSLYRYSFCQTFAEMKAPTGEWKFVLGTAFWIVAATFALVYSYYANGVFPDDPVTFSEERRRAQLKRMLILEVGPVDGMLAHWDCKNDKWKSGFKKGGF